MSNASRRRMEISLSGEAVQEGRISVSLFSKILRSVQEILFQIADCQTRREAKTKPRLSASKKECELFLVNVSPGSLNAVLELPPKEPSLFPDLPDFAEGVMHETKEVLSAVSDGDAEKFKRAVPYPDIRHTLINRIQSFAPGEGSDYSLSFSFDGGERRVLSRLERQVQERMIDKPKLEGESGGPEIKIIEAKGMAEMDQGTIKKWIETYEVSEVNIDMERVWRPRELKGKGRVFRLAHPIACVIDKQDDLFFSDDDFLGIVAWGNSREDVIQEYGNEFAMLWDGIADEEDSRLTQDALHLKQKLRALVRKVEPHGDSKSPGDRRGLD